VSLTWFSTVIDCRDPEALAAFWCQALGYQVVFRNEREVDIAPGPSSFPGLAFLRVPGRKEAKNRLHIDLNPSDQQAEVRRLLALGAARIDIGQGRVGCDGRPRGQRILHPGSPNGLVTILARRQATKITVYGWSIRQGPGARCAGTVLVRSASRCRGGRLPGAPAESQTGSPR
jgi:hypothetical protein